MQDARCTPHGMIMFMGLDFSGTWGWVSAPTPRCNDSPRMLRKPVTWLACAIRRKDRLANQLAVGPSSSSPVRCMQCVNAWLQGMCNTCSPVFGEHAIWTLAGRSFNQPEIHAQALEGGSPFRAPPLNRLAGNRLPRKWELTQLHPQNVRRQWLCTPRCEQMLGSWHGSFHRACLLHSRATTAGLQPGRHG